MRDSEHLLGGVTTGFVLTLVASTFLMGSSFVAGKILLQAGFEPMVLVGWRFFVAALATLPLMLLDKRPLWRAMFPEGVSLREAAWVIVIGLLQTTAVMGLLFLAMQSVSASTAAILVFTNPIWVAILGRLFLREALSIPRVSGLALGIVGVIFAIGIPGGQPMVGALRGEIIGVASALCWAAATIVNKRVALPFQTWALSFWQMMVGSLAVLAIAYGTGQHWPSSATPQEWAWFLWLAIPASTGSFGLWYVALAKGGATKASSYLFLAPLFTVVISYFVLETKLTWPQTFGGVLIGLALWMINRGPANKDRREQQSEMLAEGEP
jgi:drug/metabolite transporter (DMT)-like permease